MELQQYFNSCSYQIHSRRYFIKINKHGNIQKGVFMKVKKVLGIIMGILGVVLVIIEILLVFLPSSKLFLNTAFSILSPPIFLLLSPSE